MLRSCLGTTMSNPKYLLKMFFSGIETEYTEVMSYNNHDQSQVPGQNVLFKDENWMYCGYVLLQLWSIPSTCSKCSIHGSKLNILRSCLIITMIIIPGIFSKCSVQASKLNRLVLAFWVFECGTNHKKWTKFQRELIICKKSLFKFQKPFYFLVCIIWILTYFSSLIGTYPFLLNFVY